MLVPLSGPWAREGILEQMGADIAIEEINAAKPVIGGRPTRFELLSEDDQADGQRAERGCEQCLHSTT